MDHDVDRLIDYVRAQAEDARLASGEAPLDHARGVITLLDGLHIDSAGRAAAALLALAEAVPERRKAIAADWGDDVATLVDHVRKLGDISARAVHGADGATGDAAAARRQVEALRKMLLAFANDIRVVLIRLASRLQTLRFHAQARTPPAPGIARQTLEIDAPLANRLGIWQLKWELEDLAFRFEDPDTYKAIAKLLEAKRGEREQTIAAAIETLSAELRRGGIAAEINGRPKHIYSIWKKMRGKAIDFADLYDVLGLRVIVDDVKDCYTALGLIHHLWQPVPKEFDDYISRPKPNGYRSLHTVVIDGAGRPLEVQIRTREMHNFAEYGIAAHWRYKEAGTRGYAGAFSADGQYDERIAWLRQLLAWKDEAAGSVDWDELRQAELDDHIYVLSPQAQVVALPRGATPLDFAYYLHTDLGHRCRGARVDGAMVPLDTPLRNGQTVEIVTVKQGGPSRDWLNPELGYLVSQRARTKVRAWFNAMQLQETLAHGRALLDKTLQREGKTAVNLDELAHRLGFKTQDELYAALGKDEFSLRTVEQTLRGKPATDETSAPPLPSAVQRPSRQPRQGDAGAVLVVGVDALLTQLSKCCRPAPPDPIVGFVTRGKGVTIHRASCPTFLRLAQRAPERVIATGWGEGDGRVFPVDLVVEAIDRQGLLRDISEVFAREKINVTGVRTLSRQGQAKMQFTAEVPDAARLSRTLTLIRDVSGVLSAQRK